MAVKFKTNQHGHYGEDRQKETHPSFGQISVFRTEGGNPNLYGSSIRHHSKIAIEISESEKNFDLHHYWYFPTKTIIRLEMAPAQFADMLTNMNTSGVPCTITRRDHKSIDPCPEEHTRQRFEKDFQIKMDRVFSDMAEDFQTLTELMDRKKPLLQKEKAGVKSMLTRIQQELVNNLPFLESSFNKAMERVVLDAKAEIEAFYENKIRILGLEAARAKGLVGDAPIMIEGEDAEETQKETTGKGT